MAFVKPRADAQNGASGFDARARKLFLEHLALTSNVAASARKAGVASSRVYALKRKNPDFARDASPAEGACWLVSPSPVAEWSNHAGAIAQWTLGGGALCRPL